MADLLKSNLPETALHQLHKKGSYDEVPIQMVQLNRSRIQPHAIRLSCQKYMWHAKHERLFSTEVPDELRPSNPLLILSSLSSHPLINRRREKENKV